MSDIDEDDDTDAREGDQIVQQRLAPNTKKMNSKKSRVFIDYIKDKYPDLKDPADETKILLSDISPQQYKTFFGYICKKRSKNGDVLVPSKYQSYEHVSGMRLSS